MYRQSDSYLLEKLKEGDKPAFDLFFIKYYKLLVINAYMYVKDEQEAKDIVQDFLLEFWHQKIFMRLNGDVKGYLYKAIQNRCFNIQKKKIAEKEKQVYLVPDEFELDTCQVEKEEQFVLLADAMNGLPPQRREVLYRVYFGKKKYQEAADEMGISINTLKSHLKIGLKHLREKIQNK